MLENDRASLLERVCKGSQWSIWTSRPSPGGSQLGRFKGDRHSAELTAAGQSKVAGFGVCENK